MQQGHSIYTLFLLVLLLAPPVYGQDTTGSIVGTVTDATGGALPGAEVAIRSPALMGGDRRKRARAHRSRTSIEPSGDLRQSWPVRASRLVIVKAGFSKESVGILQSNFCPMAGFSLVEIAA